MFYQFFYQDIDFSDEYGIEKTDEHPFREIESLYESLPKYKDFVPAIFLSVEDQVVFLINSNLELIRIFKEDLSTKIRPKIDENRIDREVQEFRISSLLEISFGSMKAVKKWNSLNIQRFNHAS